MTRVVTSMQAAITKRKLLFLQKKDLIKETHIDSNEIADSRLIIDKFLQKLNWSNTVKLRSRMLARETFTRLNSIVRNNF